MNGGDLLTVLPWVLLVLGIVTLLRQARKRVITVLPPLVLMCGCATASRPCAVPAEAASTPEPVRSELSLRARATRGLGQTRAEVTAVLTGEPCVDRITWNWGDMFSKDSEWSQSCEGASCCANDTQTKEHTYTVPGHFTVRVTAYFRQHVQGSQVVEVYNPDDGISSPGEGVK